MSSVFGWSPCRTYSSVIVLFAGTVTFCWPLVTVTAKSPDTSRKEPPGKSPTDSVPTSACAPVAVHSAVN